MPLKERNPIF